MSERYFEQSFEENSYFIFDSKIITKEELEKQCEEKGDKAYGYAMYGEDVVKRLNEQEWEIEYLEEKCECYDKVMEEPVLNPSDVENILLEHKKHLLECKRHDEPISYWDGALDCVENLAEKLRIEL